MDGKILYSAVVLDRTSQDKLKNYFQEIMPFSGDWKIICHHMTIAFGNGVLEHQKKDIGKQVVLKAFKLGQSQKAIAVEVKGYESTNPISHITLAVNERIGGKPVDSNSITAWKMIDEITLTGTVTEIFK